MGFALPLFIQAEDKDEVGEADPVEKKQKTKQNHSKHQAAVRFTKGLTGY